MRYAFIIGSNAFIVPHGVISSSGQNGSKEILRIRSLYHDDQPGSFFSVDLHIDDHNGNPINVTDNVLEPGSSFKVDVHRNGINILRADGTQVIHIHQMDDETAMNLEHNIVAELEISMPVAVIRIFGEFKTEGLNVLAEGEKLFVNNNGYATSAMHGTDDVSFTANGVVL